MSTPTLETLLDALGPTRRPVAELWAALGVKRRDFAALLSEHRDALAAAGVELHTATTSQAAAPRLHVELDGRRVAALSLPVVRVEDAPPMALAPRPAGTLAQAAQAADTAAGAAALTMYRAGLAPHTRRAQAADLASWAGYLLAVGVEGAVCEWGDDAGCWAAVSYGLVAGFRQWLLAEGYAVATVARRLATVRKYAELAAQAGALDPDALRLIQTVHAPSGRAARNIDAERPEARREGAKKATPATLTAEQAAALKAQPNTPQGRRDALLLALLLDHGLRAGEVAALNREGLDLAAGMLTFYRSKVNKTQMHKLTADTLRAALAYLADRGDAPGALLWATDRGGQLVEGARLSTVSIWRRVKAAGAAVGAPALGPHDLRHYWATVATRAGTGVRALQEAGGWSSPAMPLRYAEAAAVANDGVKLDRREER